MNPTQVQSLLEIQAYYEMIWTIVFPTYVCTYTVTHLCFGVKQTKALIIAHTTDVVLWIIQARDELTAVEDCRSVQCKDAKAQRPLTQYCTKGSITVQPLRAAKCINYDSKAFQGIDRDPRH